MNNNNFYGNNGQFGGWGQQGGYYGYAPQPLNQAEKAYDKKQLRYSGNLFGFAVIGFVVLTFAVSSIIELILTLLQRENVLLDFSPASFAYDIIASIIYIGGPFVLAYCLLRKKYEVPQIPLGTVYNRKAAAALVAMFTPIMLFTTIAINVISSFVQGIFGVEFISGLDGQVISGFSSFIMATVAMAVVPAIVEELAVRGIMMTSLRKYGDKFAIIASAVIFSLLHGNMVQIPYTLFAGIYFGYVAVKTGSIWPAVIMHFINNFYAVISQAAVDNLEPIYANLLVLLMMGILIVCGIAGGIVYNSMNYRVSFADGVKTLKTSEKISALFLNAPMIIAVIIMLILTLLTIK